MVADREAQEALRERSCALSGHQLNPSCVCTRCLATQHDFEIIETRRTALWSELVDPDADPGALYLDSNFQPDPDFGVTRTVYLIETRERCRRCGRERVTAVEHAEPDDQSP